MGWLADRRNSKKMGDFIVRAAQRGGTFETSCSPEEILGWLKSGRCQVADESLASLTVRTDSWHRGGRIRTDKGRDPAWCSAADTSCDHGRTQSKAGKYKPERSQSDNPAH